MKEATKARAPNEVTAVETSDIDVPRWRPLLHHNEPQLGYAGVRLPSHNPVVPTRHLRFGASCKPPVPEDTGSVHDKIYEQLSKYGAVDFLSSMLDTLRQHRRSRNHIADEKSVQWKPLAQPAVSETMLDMYSRDLANRAVPFATVARRLPRRISAEKILDLLWRAPMGSSPYSVPLPRAIWLIRHECSLDIQEAEERGSNADQCIYEWNHSVLQWLQQSLDSLPTSEDQRHVWAHRWDYATALVHSLMHAQLLEPYIFYRWIVTQLDVVHGAPRACVAQLAMIHMEDILTHAALGTALVTALVRVAESSFPWLRQQSHAMLSHCVRLQPHALAHARSFLNDSRVLSQYLAQERVCKKAELLPTALFPLLPHYEAWDVAAVRALDSQTSVSSTFIAFFLPREATTEAFVKRRLHILYEWSCVHKHCDSHSGMHRAFIATALVRLLDECQSQRLASSDGRMIPCPWKPISIPEVTLQWTDKLVSASELNLVAAARLLGSLAEINMFSYMLFLQRLSTRGLVRSGTEPRLHHHRLDSHDLMRLLRSIPTHRLTAAQQQQRRLAIYGPRPSESYEETVERRAIRELHHVFHWHSDVPNVARSPAQDPPRSTVTSPDAYSANSLCASPAPYLSRSTAASPNPYVTRISVISPTLEANELVSPKPASPATPSDPTADILEAFQLRTRLPHLWNASPYVQARIVNRFLSPMLFHDLSALNADRFALTASVLTKIHAMQTLGRLMCALLDGHNLSCVISICHTVVMYARIWDALEIAPDLVERIVPYAITEPVVSSEIERVISVAGRGMTVAMARRALHALGELDVSVPNYAPMPQAPLVKEPDACAEQLFVSLCHTQPTQACVPIAQHATLDEAAAHLLVYALDKLAQSPTYPPAALSTLLATLAGTVGVRLDENVHAWIHRTWRQPSAHATSSMWIVLVVGLVRHGFVHAPELLQRVIAPFMEQAPASHPGWDACMSLLFSLVFTCTAERHPCSIDILGEAGWYDVNLLRADIAYTDGFVPLLSALDLCETPHRWQCWNVLSHQVPKLHALWMARPDAIWRGTLTLRGKDRFQRVRRLIHALMEQEPRGTLPQPRAATMTSSLHAPSLNVNDLYEGSLAALQWRLVLEEAKTITAEVGRMLLAPRSSQAPIDLVLQWDASPHIVSILAQYALHTFVQAIDTPHHLPNAISGLAHLMYAYRCASSIECDVNLATQSVQCLTRLPTSLAPVLRASAILSVLRCAARVHSDAWLVVLANLCDEARDSPLALTVAAHVQCWIDPTVLDTWLRSRVSTNEREVENADAGSVSSLLRYSRDITRLRTPLPADLVSSPWDWHDQVSETPVDAVPADPWSHYLHNGTSVPLSLFHAQKTRDRVPICADAPPTRLVSETSYGDGDDAVTRYKPMTNVPVPERGLKVKAKRSSSRGGSGGSINHTTPTSKQAAHPSYVASANPDAGGRPSPAANSDNDQPAKRARIKI